jgi:hypothetical protein
LPLFHLSKSTKIQRDEIFRFHALYQSFHHSYGNFPVADFRTDCGSYVTTLMVQDTCTTTISDIAMREACDLCAGRRADADLEECLYQALRDEKTEGPQFSYS